MRIKFDKIIIKFIFSKIKKKIKININTKFDDINEFDSLNFVQLIIYLNEYNVNIELEKLSKVKTVKDLINACKKNK